MRGAQANKSIHTQSTFDFPGMSLLLGFRIKPQYGDSRHIACTRFVTAVGLVLVGVRRAKTTPDALDRRSKYVCFSHCVLQEKIIQPVSQSASHSVRMRLVRDTTYHTHMSQMSFMHHDTDVFDFVCSVHVTVHIADLCGRIERLWTRNVVHDQRAEGSLEVNLHSWSIVDGVHACPAPAVPLQ